MDTDLIARHAGRDARVLDLGCGYGRTLRALWDDGFRRLSGLEPSPKMVERCRALVPEASVAVLEGLPAPPADGSFDALLLVAVLTCVPGDAEQRALVGEALRLLRPGGVVYVVDFLLGDDARNRERYGRGVPGHAAYGVFRLPDGAVHRHHDPAWVAELLSPFERLHRAEFPARTRNGNPARAFAFLGRRSA